MTASAHSNRCVCVYVTVYTYLPVFIWALPAATAPNSLELSLSNSAVRPLSRGKTRRRRQRPTWRWPRNDDGDLCMYAYVVCVDVFNCLWVFAVVVPCKSTRSVASNSSISISIITYPMKLGVRLRVYPMQLWHMYTRFP